MIRRLKAALAAAVAASLMLPAAGSAKPADAKRDLRIVVRPKPPSKYGPNGFLPGYRQPPPLAEWRDRSPRHGGGDFSRDRRYWARGAWGYGWGGARVYRRRSQGGGLR